jgi:hypothetical protein
MRTDVVAVLCADDHGSHVRLQEAKMKSVVLATALTLIASDATLAASQQNTRSQRALNARAMVVVPDSSNVYLDGQLIGRDPDPNVRFRLRSDHYSGQGN